jgi:hypothetical protein
MGPLGTPFGVFCVGGETSAHAHGKRDGVTTPHPDSCRPLKGPSSQLPATLKTEAVAFA